MPGPIIKPNSFPGISGLPKPVKNVIDFFFPSDDPTGGLSPVPIGMALGPLQKALAKRTLENMAIGQLPAKNAVDILKTMGTTSQDLGNLIPTLPEELRGVIRTSFRKGWRSLWPEYIPWAESTASPTKPLLGHLKGSRTTNALNARKQSNPVTVKDWLKQLSENPAVARRLGGNIDELNTMRDFLSPMRGTPRAAELSNMSLEDFRPIYQELLERTGWKP